MSTTKYADGDTLLHSPSADVAAGDGCVIGNKVWFAPSAVVSGVEGVFYAAQVWTFTKQGTHAITQGDACYWDAVNLYMTTVKRGNAFAGACHVAAGSSATTVEVNLGVGQTDRASLEIPLTALVGEDGTALAKFADGASATPGHSQESNKELVVRWNDHAAPTALSFAITLPADLDSNEDVTVHWKAAMSGSTDTPEITHECYFERGDTDCAGTDDEIDGGTTLTEYTATIAAANVPAGPCHLSVNFKPKGGELGTDDCLIYGVWLEYTRLP